MAALPTPLALHVRDLEACVASCRDDRGLRDPDGKVVEFSHGQPPGPGAGAPGQRPAH